MPLKEKRVRANSSSSSDDLIVEHVVKRSRKTEEVIDVMSDEEGELFEEPKPAETSKLKFIGDPSPQVEDKARTTTPRSNIDKLRFMRKAALAEKSDDPGEETKTAERGTSEDTTTWYLEGYEHLNQKGPDKLPPLVMLNCRRSYGNANAVIGKEMKLVRNRMARLRVKLTER